MGWESGPPQTEMLQQEAGRGCGEGRPRSGRKARPLQTLALESWLTQLPPSLVPGGHSSPGLECSDPLAKGIPLSPTWVTSFPHTPPASPLTQPRRWSLGNFATQAGTPNPLKSILQPHASPEHQSM